MTSTNASVGSTSSAIRVRNWDNPSPVCAETNTASGSARRSGGPWQLSLDGTGPAGIGARLRGSAAADFSRLDVALTGSAPLSLASGDASARVPYQQAELPMTLSRESYLWQQPAVLLVGEWKNTSPLPWLAGSVTLLRDGQRLTRYHRSESIKQGEQIKMSFGDDPRLQIDVVREPSREGETGLISKESTLSALKNITLTSHYDKPVTVNLQTSKDREFS